MIALLAIAGLPALLEVAAAVTAVVAAVKLTLDAVEVARRLKPTREE